MCFILLFVLPLGVCWQYITTSIQTNTCNLHYDDVDGDGDDDGGGGQTPKCIELESFVFYFLNCQYFFFIFSDCNEMLD